MVHEVLLSWYQTHGRRLPWRAWPRNVYHVLVSELMLQQTQVARVLPKFTAFIARWPTFKSLAGAQQSEVVVMWAGLGYNRRAKYLLETARYVVNTFKGVFPTNPEEIQKLPGIGPYTARALRVFALGEQTYMIDTNIKRILQRVFIGIQSATVREIEEVAKRRVPVGRADAWHQALMDFGSAVCLSTPRCEVCPLARVCKANQQAREAGFETYALYLRHEREKKRGKSDFPAATRIPFRSTDRYFRGRIIEYLRAGPVPMSTLKDYVSGELLLTDVVRFGTLIESLMKEGMIRISGSMVMLA